MKNSDTVFRKNLLAFIRSEGNNIYHIFELFALKLINRMRFAHLQENNFRYDFADTVNPLCPYRPIEIKKFLVGGGRRGGVEGYQL